MDNKRHLTLDEVKSLVQDPNHKWRYKSACTGLDSKIFFPNGLKGAGTYKHKKKAKSICGQCDTRSECLAFAIAHTCEYGIFGGLTPKERKGLYSRLPMRDIFQRKDKEK